MIYRKPGFLAVVLSTPRPPLSRQQVVSLSQPSCVSPVELTEGRWAERVGGRGAKYDGEKAWPSINNSILQGRSPIGRATGCGRWPTHCTQSGNGRFLGDIPS
jgi:hypothetical protein